jgi:ABC-type branched-subunit amino acid transport system permease subunit
VITGLLQVTVFQTVRTQEVQLFLISLLDVTQYKLLFFGLILVLMMLLRPEGLVPSVTSKRKGT